jgi:ribosomal protein L29
MTKLKSLLEGFAWERKDGKPLPTLAEVQAEYEAKQKAELDEKAAYDDASENELASYISKLSTELSNETNPDKIKLLKQDIADVKQKLKDKKGNSPRWQDNDGDGKWYEPGVDVKENVNESFTSRLKKNLIGGSLRK